MLFLHRAVNGEWNLYGLRRPSRRGPLAREAQGERVALEELAVPAAPVVRREVTCTRDSGTCKRAGPSPRFRQMGAAGFYAVYFYPLHCRLQFGLCRGFDCLVQNCNKL